MSRTYRIISHSTKRYLKKYPEDYNIRDERHNGYDDHSRSVLYEGAILSSGWNRDSITGSSSRRFYKKIARRQRRREKIDFS